MERQGDFSFRIDFKKGSGNPRRVFDAASALIDAFQSLDRAVLPSIDGKIETALVLEDVGAGSIRIKLANALKSVDEGALKSGDWKRVAGEFLNGVRLHAIKFLEDEEDAPARMLELKQEIVADAQKTDVRHLPDYAPVHEGRLVSALDKVQKAKAILETNDALSVEIKDKVYRINLTETWLPSDVVEAVPIEEAIEEENRIEMVLTVRKPDLLRDTMWQFVHGKSNISAALRDEAWLDAYRRRAFAILPGDALKCTVHAVYSYDEKGDLIDTHMEVVKVHSVIPGSIQDNLPF